MLDMKAMLPALVLILLAAEPAGAGAIVPEPPPRASFEGLFTDWNAASRQSIEAEREAARRPAPHAAPADAPAGAPGSIALGERVGEIVALGDCAEGERIARAAGDFALVAAVREHCTAAVPDE
jgi:hypothetical protein